MPTSMKSLGLDNLSLEQRLSLVHEIWDSIAAEYQPSLSQEQREELDLRVAEHERDPSDVIPWEHVKREALNRLEP